MAGLINYVKKAFKNYPNTTTKISAENLNHLDDGIFDLDQAVKSAIDGINDDIDRLNNDLTASNSQKFKFSYDSSTQKYGYTIESGGADTFFPFKSQADIDEAYNAGIQEVINNPSKYGLGDKVHTVRFTSQQGMSYDGNKIYTAYIDGTVVKSTGWTSSSIDWSFNV